MTLNPAASTDGFHEDGGITVCLPETRAICLPGGSRVTEAQAAWTAWEGGGPPPPPLEEELPLVQLFKTNSIFLLHSLNRSGTYFIACTVPD